MECKICNIEFKSFGSLSQHLKKHNISPKEYYDKYFKKDNDGICECGNKTEFKRLSSGYREFCSCKCSVNSKKTKKKYRDTCLDRYGTTIPIRNEEIQNKRKITNMNKFGVEYAQQTDEFKNRVRITNLIKYGNECSLLNDEVDKKRTDTMIKKYGSKNPFDNQDILNKRTQTYIEKYNVDNPMKNKIIYNKKRQTDLNKIIPKVKKMLDYLDLEMMSDYIHYREPIKIKCRKCDTIFETIYFNIYQGCGRCPKCYPKYISTRELELYEYLQLLDVDIIKNDRIIINPSEIDFYIPSKNIAIEFDGLYWHSEVFHKDKNYHLDKTKKCLDNNIQLIHIFEDEWVLKKDIVKSRLKQLFGLNNVSRIHARKCQIKEISPKIKNEFLNKYHIQGEDKSSVKLGAFYNNELISIMTFSRSNISRSFKVNSDIWELSRFCSNSNYHIPGIASKILSYFKKNYKWKEIFSYADRRWSMGNVYKKIGFELESITKPNYWYVKGLNRIHRFNLRKREDEPKDIPEWILRHKDGYHRIYDCGHYKFKMKGDESVSHTNASTKSDG